MDILNVLYAELILCSMKSKIHVTQFALKDAVAVNWMDKTCFVKHAKKDTY